MLTRRSDVETSAKKASTISRGEFSVAAALGYGTADKNKGNEYLILIKVKKTEIEAPVVKVTSGIQAVMWIT